MTTARISAIGKVIRGVSWDKNDATDTERPDYLPILRAGNIGNELNVESDLVWVPASNVGNEQKIQAGDIAICMSSGSPAVVGKTASAKVGWPGSVGAFCALIRANPERCLPEYLAFFLKTARFRKWTSESQGANIKNIKKSALEDFEVPVPPLSEQRRIVDLLSRAEGIVRLRREAEKKAAELIPALFLEMFGDPATNPKAWRTSSLDSVLSETKLGLVRGAKEMDVKKSFPYVRMDAVGGGSVRVSALKRVDATEKEIGEYSLRYGDFLFNTRNSKELVGKTGMFKDGNESVCLFNNNLMRMRFDGTSLLPEYVNALFQTSYIQKQLEAIKRGTTSVFAIYYKDLRHIELRLPDLKLQQEFAERAIQIDSIKAQQAAATAKAQATYSALLAQVFSSETYKV